AVSDAQATAVAKLLGVNVQLGSSNKPHFTGDTEQDVLMWLRLTIRVFTTRPDTLFGATFLILSTEHPWVQLAVREDHKGVLRNRDDVLRYIVRSGQK